MSTAIVPYQPQASFLPLAVRGVLAGASTLQQAANAVSNTRWFLSKTKGARRSIMNSVRSMYSGSSNSMGAPQAAPVAINRRIRGTRAQMRSSANVNGGLTIQHREYLGELSGSTTFDVSSYEINPGLSTAFPWLSSIAPSFEKYKVTRMSYEYVNIAATSERGRVTMAFDYDVLDENPTSKVELFQYAGASEGAVWSSLNLPVKNIPEKFTRVGTVSTSDKKTYDAGKLLVGVSNTASTAIVGEIFVNYIIELNTPQPASCPSKDLQIGGVTDKNAIFSNGTGTYIISGNLNVVRVNNGIEFPLPGVYQVSVNILDASTGPGSFNTGASTVTILQGYQTGSSTSQQGMWFVRATAPNQLFAPVSSGTITLAETNCFVSKSSYIAP
jgi:hypothetical protein